MFQPIIDQIRQEIYTQAISEAEMARDLGIPQSTLNRILTGKRNLGSRVAAQILKARPSWIKLINGEGLRANVVGNRPDCPDSAISEP